MIKFFAKKEDVPAELADGAFELKDGRWAVAEPAPDSGGESVAVLERTVKALRKERDEVAGKLREAQQALTDATKKIETLEAGGAQTDQRIAEMLTKWKADTEAAVAAAVAEKDKQLAAVGARVEKYELDDKLTAAFVKKGGRAERTARALVLAKQDGWKLVDGAAVRIGEDGQPQTISPEDYFEKHFRVEVPEFFTGSMAAGGGAGAAGAPGTPGGAGAGNKPPTKWTADERRAYIEANGQAAYRALLDGEMTAVATAAPVRLSPGTA